MDVDVISLLEDLNQDSHNPAHTEEQRQWVQVMAKHALDNGGMNAGPRRYGSQTIPRLGQQPAGPSTSQPVVGGYYNSNPTNHNTNSKFTDTFNQNRASFSGLYSAGSGVPLDEAEQPLRPEAPIMTPGFRLGDQTASSADLQGQTPCVFSSPMSFFHPLSKSNKTF